MKDSVIKQEEVCPAWENQDKTRYETLLLVFFRTLKILQKFLKLNIKGQSNKHQISTEKVQYPMT